MKGRLGAGPRFQPQGSRPRLGPAMAEQGTLYVHEAGGLPAPSTVALPPPRFRRPQDAANPL